MGLADQDDAQQAGRCMRYTAGWSVGWFEVVG